jgi:hypothetical protein
MTVRKLLSLLLLAMVTLVAGCNKAEDVTHDPGFGNFGAVIGVWKSKVPMGLGEERGELWQLHD